jgi:SAM-dependent methyltransferase
MSDNITTIIRRRFSRLLTRLGQEILPPPPRGKNLLGDRDLEWTWIMARIPNGPGEALDLGSGKFWYLALTAAQKQFQVLSIDREQYVHYFVPEGITVQNADLLTKTFPVSFYDLILSCSTMEHIGLPDRYGVRQYVVDGDLAVMRKLHSAIKPNGILLMTIPVGQDEVFLPNHRIYGNERLPLLLGGWLVDEERYWIKQMDDCWHAVSRAEAVSTPGGRNYYGIGCFALKKGNT